MEFFTDMNIGSSDLLFMAFDLLISFLTLCLFFVLSTGCFIFQIVDWILGPAERLLTSQTEIGDSHSSADQLRKQHEQLELKCTVSYRDY